MRIRQPSVRDRSPRIWRIGDSNYYDDELIRALDSHTGQKLAEVSNSGFDSVWIGARLYDLIPLPTATLKEYRNAQRRLQNIRKLIERCRSNGLGLYLYFNEPRGLPVDSPRWHTIESWRGAEYLDVIENQKYAGFCLRCAPAYAWFQAAVKQCLLRTRGLAGVILITSSEHHTHCWSHHFPFRHGPSELGCPRCSSASPSEMVSKAVSAWSSANTVLPQPVRILAWNWSWSFWYPDPQKEIIQTIPRGAELILDWERGGQLRHEERVLPVDEYSLAFVGPSSRFRRSMNIARKIGLNVHAKLQIGTTHELATVPNIPLLFSLCRKLDGMKKLGIGGFLGTWLMGCEFSANTALVVFHDRYRGKFSRPDKFLSAFAEEYFGLSDGRSVASAWRGFSRAFMSYPFSIPYLYRSPMNWMPKCVPSKHYRAVPLKPSWHYADDFGDRLDDCFGPLTVDEIAIRLENMAVHWSQALARYERLNEGPASADVPTSRAVSEYRIAQAIGLLINLAANYFQFAADRARLPEWKGWQVACQVADVQMVHDYRSRHVGYVRQLIDLVIADARIGYHQESGAHFYTAVDLKRIVARG